MRFFALLVLVGLTTAYKDYKGYHLVDITLETVEQVHFLHDFYINTLDVDFWDQPARVGQTVRVLVDGYYFNGHFADFLRSNKLSYVVADTDFGRVIEEERVRLSNKKVFDLDDFNTFEDIEVWLSDSLTTCANAGLVCSLSSLGPSVEGRDIWLFTITSTVPSGKSVLYVDSLTHAREYLAGASVFKVMDKLWTDYGQDPEVTALLDHHEFHFVPVVNPDGYVYTWTDERLWRKNRGLNDGIAINCTGTDLNRNFAFRWGWNGVSNAACSDIYCGPSAGSEPETKAVMGHFDTIQDNAYAVVTIHSYGYYWMHPWGNTVEPYDDRAQCDRTMDHDELFRVATLAGTAAEDAMPDLTQWSIGNSCEVIYTTSGATEDHARGANGIVYGFCIEVRGNGFVVPASEIDPSFQEVWASIVAMHEAIDNPPAN